MKPFGAKFANVWWYPSMPYCRTGQCGRLRLVVKPGPEASSNRGVTDDGRFWALLRLAREGSAVVTEDGEQWHSICVINLVHFSC